MGANDIGTDELPARQDTTPQHQAPVPAPEENKPLPLRATPAKGTRIKPGLIWAITGGMGAVTAVAVVMALQPHHVKAADPRQQQKEAAQAAQADLTPTMPDSLAAIPSTYGPTADTNSVVVPKLGAPLHGDLGYMEHSQAQQNLAAAASIGATQSTAEPAPTVPAIKPLTPAQQRAEQLAEERAKQAQAARSAPVEFAMQQGSQAGPTAMPTSLQGPGPAGGSIAPEQARPTENEDQNMQDEKRSFAKFGSKSDPYLHQPLITPRSPYQLMAGTLIPAIMVTGINTDLPGHIAAQVSQNVYDSISGKYLLIPQGSKLLGEYDSKISYGQERILIAWSRLIMPNGASIMLEGMPGVDLRGFAGVKDGVNNHYLKMLGGVVLGSVIGAGAQLASGPTSPAAPTFGQLVGQGAAQNINQAGQQVTSKNLNLQPTLTIPYGYRVNVFVTKDIILKPYGMTNDTEASR